MRAARERGRRNHAHRDAQATERVEALLNLGEVVKAVLVGVDAKDVGSDGELDIVGQAIAVAVVCDAGNEGAADQRGCAATAGGQVPALRQHAAHGVEGDEVHRQVRAEEEAPLTAVAADRTQHAVIGPADGFQRDIVVAVLHGAGRVARAGSDQHNPLHRRSGIIGGDFQGRALQADAGGIEAYAQAGSRVGRKRQWCCKGGRRCGTVHRKHIARFQHPDAGDRKRRRAGIAQRDHAIDQLGTGADVLPAQVVIGDVNFQRRAQAAPLAGQAHPAG